jgi:HSP20 family molecular chaperone IbpA
MKAYLVWEIVDDYPEDGGGEYLENIFLNYDKAKVFLKGKQKEAREEETDNYISYEIREFEIEE